MASLPLSVDQATVDTSRFECIDGHLVERPLPNNLHSETQFNVTALLKPQARQKGCVALQEWTLDEDNRPFHNWLTPDVLVAPKSSLAPSGHCLPPAILAVEVLSDKQTFEKMLEKAGSYFRWGVEHVWILDPVHRSAQVVHADDPFAVSTYTEEGTITADDFSISLADAFVFE